MSRPYTSVLLNDDRYLEALRSAEAKDRTKNYRILKANRALALLYNPDTRDGKFSTKLNAKAELLNGYYMAYPWCEYAETLAENNTNLEKYGWPDYSDEGV